MNTPLLSPRTLLRLALSGHQCWGLACSLNGKKQTFQNDPLMSTNGRKRDVLSARADRLDQTSG
jgi:hypothetical protein